MLLLSTKLVTSHCEVLLPDIQCLSAYMPLAFNMFVLILIIWNSDFDMLESKEKTRSFKFSISFVYVDT